MELFVAICSCLSAAICSYLQLSGAIWSYLELSGAICNYLQLSGPIWSFLELSEQTYSPQRHKPRNHKPTIQNPEHTNQKVGGRRKRRLPVDPPPPARRGRGVPDAFANSDEFVSICRLQKLFGDPGSSADHPGRKHLFTHPPYFSKLFIFGAAQKSSKIGPLSNPSKISKIRSPGAQS